MPLAVAVPAAAAGLAYFNARTSFFYDWNLVSSVAIALTRIAVRERKDRLNFFYILEERAEHKATAESVFVMYDGREWTFRRTYEMVLKYGTWLKQAYDIKPKEIVAMNFMNSDKFIFLWLGLWSIGAKPAFINYSLANKALGHCIRVSTTRLTFVDPEVWGNITEELRGHLPDVQFVAFTPEIEAAIMETQAVREPDSVRSDDKAQNLAILIYTSGTTGLPKPAVVSWQKCIIGASHVARWAHYRRPDILYTVSLNSIASLPRPAGQSKTV